MNVALACLHKKLLTCEDTTFNYWRTKTLLSASHQTFLPNLIMD